jgi:hypothetical protein
MHNEQKPSWWKPGIESKGSVCFCCGQTREILPLDTLLYDGFGGWSITKNGSFFFQEDPNKEFEDSMTLQGIEDMIGEDTENEYCANLFLPLRGATYQRHSKNNWVLIEKNDGFA